MAVLTLVAAVGGILNIDCIKKTACSCEINGDIIDLTPLANKNNTPRFKDVQGTEPGSQFSWNPCYPFSEGVGCTNVSACQKQVWATYAIGKQESAEFINDPINGLTIHYQAIDTVGVIRDSYVSIDCGPNEGDLTAQGEVGQAKYYMTLKTKYACVAGGSAGGLSAGSILIIIVICAVVVYLIGGVLVMRFVKGARGTEMIPNESFWKSLPGLIKDGGKFVIHGCKAEKSYASI
ncbi:putative mannose 6-phosphate receptor-like protein C530.09c [Lingula anatina]|uniref:Autophagy-related protein 27 n=1 Tax=Lingula anatina TaxID=7574 RepID=A0A1S3JIF7_LINAN|nr:putative mannose 6-phosphate receptor-like protein C530.09c [Lingula anatina]|eukprot:XP_013409684.1 putative mannose 6-phosphate receptor-like protein C530.09c [Lingula anatina]